MINFGSFEIAEGPIYRKQVEFSGFKDLGILNKVNHKDTWID